MTPVKVGIVEERFKPSYSVKKILKQVKRVHNFQCHEPVKYVELDKLAMNRETGKLICDYLEYVDISDTVKKFEELAEDKQIYDCDIRDYLAEEWDCPVDYSYAIVAVFSYMKQNDVSVQIALQELFTLSSLKSLCDKCVIGPKLPQDKIKASEYFNFTLVRSMLVDCAVESDDSFKDPDCVLSEEEKSLSYESSETEKVTSVLNPLTSKKDSTVFEFKDDLKVFNPFMASDESDKEIEPFMPNINSTVIEFKSSSLKNNKFNVNCNFCSKTFSNRQLLVKVSKKVEIFILTCFSNMSWSLGFFNAIFIILVLNIFFDHVFDEHISFAIK